LDIKDISLTVIAYIPIATNWTHPCERSRCFGSKL